MTSSNPSPPTFRFLQLPGEVRNLVYRHLVVSPHEHPSQLSLSQTSDYQTGIDTNILYVNKEIYAEASSILYSENNPIIEAAMYPASQKVFRKDNVKLTTRSLRSGRQCSMTDFSGRIYPHVLARFARVKIASSFIVNETDSLVKPQWTMSNRFLQSIVSELCDHKYEGRGLQKRELVISMTFSGKNVLSAVWARRFQKFIDQNSWKPSEKTLEYVVRLEGIGSAGLLDSLKEIFEGEMGGLKAVWA